MVKRCWITPVITIYIERFSKILGREISVEELSQFIPWLGVDIEDIGEDYIKIEYNPNRPDFGTPIGVARNYLGIRGSERGIIRYNIKDSNLEIIVDNSVKNVRPYIMGGIIKNLELDEDTLNEIIGFQEDLHMGIGRRRRKMAIGLHNLKAIRFPIRYTTVDEKFSFIPLGFEEETTIKEILEYHPKGKEYGYILSDFKKYPIIIDDENKVLSFPPIINGVYTEIKPGDKNIFIDVTGTEPDILSKTLNLLVTTLSDYGGELYSIHIIDGKKISKAPILEYKEQIIKLDDINRLLGLDLTPEEVINALKASRFEAFYEKMNNTIIGVVPPYRIDILHPVDLIEEVALGYGFWRIEPQMPKLYTTGSLVKKDIFENKIVDLMIGFGFQEVMNPILTNPEEQYDYMMINRMEYIEIKAPKSKLYRSIRTWITPILMKNLYKSKSAEYPQKIFEIGPTIHLQNNKTVEETHLAVAIISADTGYSEIKSVFDSFLRLLGIRRYTIKKTLHKSFIAGRVGEIIMNNKSLGIIGEIHPQVLNNFQLAFPVTAFEVNLDAIFAAEKSLNK